MFKHKYVRCAVGLLLSVALFSGALAQGYKGSDGNSFGDKLPGRWLIDTVINQEAPKIAHKAVQEFMANGAMNEDGQVIIWLVDQAGDQLEMACRMRSTYDWETKGAYLYQRSIDVSISPDYFKINGKVSDNKQTLTNFCNTASKVFIGNRAKGKTSEYKILQIDQVKIVYESKDENGKAVRQTDFRTEKSFSAYRK
jgi:hypothetical protein